MAVRGTYSTISVAMAPGLRWAVESLQVTSSHRIVAPWCKYIWSVAGQSESFGAPNFLTLWASDSKRVIQTVDYSADSLRGVGWSSKYAELRSISETSILVADTLTPGDTCLAY